jgi:hypothetical protein
MTELNNLPHDLDFINKHIYMPSSYILTEFINQKEGSEYDACSFFLNNKKIVFRKSKITPTKTGQFVTIWKRNEAGITAPFDSADDLDFIIITLRDGENFGQFIFPKSVLLKQGIISQNGKGGKRGIRVYAPWDIANSKQAEKTKKWQSDYFLIIQKDGSTDLALAKKLPHV